MNSEISRLNMLDTQLNLALQEVLGKLRTGGQHAAPACHLWEDDKAFRVRLALRGWQPHQMCLEVQNDMLTMQGERSFETFLQLFKLPAFISTEKARAVYNDGLLTISFPKRPEGKARRILIEVR